MRKLFLACSVIGSLFLASQALALSISLNATDTGTGYDVAIGFTGAPALGGAQFDLLYDPLTFAYVPDSFENWLGGLTDPPWDPASSFSLDSSGTVFVVGLNTNPTDTGPFPRGDFTLAVLSFTDLGTNSPAGFRISNVVLSDPAGKVVPEPGTMILVGSGLAGLAGYSRKRKKG